MRTRHNYLVNHVFNFLIGNNTIHVLSIYVRIYVYSFYGLGIYYFTIYIDLQLVYFHA